MPQISAVLVRLALKPGQLGLLAGSFEKGLLVAVDPDQTITRFRRTWRFSRPDYLGAHVVGKLGFISTAETTEVHYDESKKDFVEQPLSASKGYYSHWAVDLESHVMAFEIRPPEIRIQSFIGAFKKLLEAHPETSLTVEVMTEADMSLTALE